MTRQLKCVVLGSFNKFKPQIDEAITELTGNGVVVLGPQKGGLCKSEYSRQGFWPTRAERGFSPDEIEDDFLRRIDRSDFVYVVCPDGYIGTTVGFEIGRCLAFEKDVYTSHDIDVLLDPDFAFKNYLSSIRTMSVTDAVRTEVRLRRAERELLSPLDLYDEIRKGPERG